MYDLLTIASINNPIEDNAEGSLLTMSSVQALIFGIINIVGNFGTVFVDNAYWQRAIAAHPMYAVKAYLIGGLAWYAIPFTLATTMGLTGRALGIELTDAEVTAGLVLPDACVALLGSSGAWIALLLVFLAVTSASSAELIAVSSIFTYDIFRAYIKPDVSFADACWLSWILLLLTLRCINTLGFRSIGDSFLALISTHLWYPYGSIGNIA